VEKWCNKWGFQISPSKLAAVLFTNKRNLPPVAARGEIGREGCEISSLVEHMGLSPWLFS